MDSDTPDLLEAERAIIRRFGMTPSVVGRTPPSLDAQGRAALENETRGLLRRIFLSAVFGDDATMTQGPVTPDDLR